MTEKKDLGKPNKKTARWTFTIDKVYYGPPNLERKTFCYDDLPVPTLDRKVSFLEKGAVGLWWVYKHREVQQGVVIDEFRPELRSKVIDKYQIRPFPFLDTKYGSIFDGKPHDGKEEFKVGLAWAEAVERVGKAADADARKRLLEELAESKVVPIAEWAQSLLGQEQPSGRSQHAPTCGSSTKWWTMTSGHSSFAPTLPACLTLEHSPQSPSACGATESLGWIVRLRLEQNVAAGTS